MLQGKVLIVRILHRGTTRLSLSVTRRISWYTTLTVQHLQNYVCPTKALPQWNTMITFVGCVSVRAHRCHICIGTRLAAATLRHDWARRCRICTRTGPTAATSAPHWAHRCHICTALGPPLPHLHQDWAHPGHICTSTGPTPPASALGLRPPHPHLQQDWAHPSHICSRTGLTPPTSAAGLGSPHPHLQQDWAHPSHICSRTRPTHTRTHPLVPARRRIGQDEAQRPYWLTHFHAFGPKPACASPVCSRALAPPRQTRAGWLSARAGHRHWRACQG
jgi:hypothetical protein